MIKAQLGQLLEKEMDRKDFLRHVGVAAAVSVGIPAILGALGRLQTGSQQPNRQVGYGSSAYGGNQPPKKTS